MPVLEALSKITGYDLAQDETDHLPLLFSGA